MIVACIPAYMESNNIGNIVIETRKHVDVVLVCDDGSSDETCKVAASAGAVVIRHAGNLGKGAALRTLFATALNFKPDIVVMLDADRQHDPNEIPKLIEPIRDGAADIVIGSRYLGSTENMPNYRKIGAKMLDRATISLSHVKVNDTQSGFRALSFYALKQLTLKSDSYSIESEMILNAAEMRLRFTEVPITIRYEGETSKAKPVPHFYGITEFLFKRYVMKNPFLVFGSLAALFFIGAMFFTLRVFELYENTGYVSMPQALIAVFLALLSGSSFLTAVSLTAIRIIAREIR